MKEDTPQHPEKDQLVAFGMGMLLADEAERIAQHLDICRDCSETIFNLQDDTFVSLVRSSSAPTSRTSAPPAPIGSPKTFPAGPVEVESGATGGDASYRDELPLELRQHPRYELQRLIGRGGMGAVYKAQHKIMQRAVALKVIRPELVRNDAAIERFRREVQAAARLQHPNIVAAHDAEQAGDVHYLVMEFVDGENLDEVLRRNEPLSVAEACDYIRQAADGLQHAHDLGMVHRDIKPHNLMIAQRTGTSISNSPVVKILDFGLAHLASEVVANELGVAEEVAEPESASAGRLPTAATIARPLTQVGTMMGTPDYIAPEQVRDAHSVDVRADIYSLGCTFYALLAGKPPFSDASVPDKIKSHVEKQVPAIATIRDDVPKEVETVLHRMVAKDPADRYQTPVEVAEALAFVVATLRRSTGDEEHRHAGGASLRRRNPRLLAGVATFLLALFAAVVFYIQTNHGVVRVEIVDSLLDVALSGRTITTSDNGQPLTIRAGEQKLVVRRGDFQFETDSFQLRRGGEVTLKVELLHGEVVVSKDGHRFGAKSLPDDQLLAQEGQRLGEPTSSDIDQPVTIGMNDDFGLLFQGQLVAPAELSRRLEEALAKNPDRVVAIDLPRKPWTISPHVDQLEQIAHIVGAKHCTRPGWAEIRIVFGVEESGMQALDIQGGDSYSASGELPRLIPNIHEVVAKNPGLPVLLGIAEGIDLADPQVAEGFNAVRRAAEATGAKIRLEPALKAGSPPEPSPTLDAAGELPGDGKADHGLLYLQDGRLVCGGETWTEATFSLFTV